MVPLAEAMEATHSAESPRGLSALIMQSATDKLAEVLKPSLLPPKATPVSNVDAQPHHTSDEIREILVKQVVHPVLWEKSMQTLLDAGIVHFCEIGPGTGLKMLEMSVSATNLRSTTSTTNRCRRERSLHPRLAYFRRTRGAPLRFLSERTSRDYPTFLTQ
ncbi:MAG: hypothetical protein R3C12_11110 [Planctomycetaceae bacterium]